MYADVAHPVERHLAKVEVASSSLVIRSTPAVEQFTPYHAIRGVYFFMKSPAQEEEFGFAQNSVCDGNAP